MGFFDRFKKKKHQEEELNEQEAVLDENFGETSTKSELPDIPKLKRLFSLTVEFPQPRSRSNPGITLRSRLPKPKRKSR